MDYEFYTTNKPQSEIKDVANDSSKYVRRKVQTIARENINN